MASGFLKKKKKVALDTNTSDIRIPLEIGGWGWMGWLKVSQTCPKIWISLPNHLKSQHASTLNTAIFPNHPPPISLLSPRPSVNPDG